MAIIWVIKGTPITNPDGTVTPGLDQNAYVDHLVQDGSYVKSLNYGNTLVWEELIGTYQTGSLPNGVASLTCTRTSKDPAISAGTLSNGEQLYNDDTLTFSATPDSCWTASMTHSSVTVSGADPTSTTRERVIYGVTESGVSATAQMFTLKASNFNISGDIINISYYDKDGNKQTYTETATGSAAAIISSLGIQCWRGGLVSWSVTSGSGYWTGNSGTISAGYQQWGSTRTVVAKTRKTRYIRFYKVTGVASYSVTYTDSNGTRTTTTLTPTSTYSSIAAFIGATVTWTATATSGYTVSPSSGTISASTSTTAVTVKPTATALSKGWYDYPAQTTGSASWSASSTTSWPSTTTSSTQYPLSSWDYLGVHTRSRISGTITVSGSYKTTFTNVEINNSSFTSVATVSVDFGVAADTFTLYVKGNNALNMYVTNTASILVRPAVAVSITSIQVYTYPASVTLSAPVNNGYDSDSYCFNVSNNNAVAVSCVYNGTAIWGSSDELDTGGSWEHRGPTISANDSYYVGSSDVIGTSEDESVAEMNLEMAFVADDYLNMSSSTAFDV